VTGANGFLGRHVTAALLARGQEVRALVRPSAAVSLPPAPGLEVFRADLLATDDLRTAFTGVDVLVHLAAAVSGSDDVQYRTAVEGTERLLRAMVGTSCRRIVLASSFAVYDWSAIEGTLHEDSPTEPAADLQERDGYARAKAAQEEVARRRAAEHGWALTVLRPGFIWGRGHGYPDALAPRAAGLRIVIGPRSLCPLTHVENCADLFAVAAIDPRASGRTLNVVDGEGVASIDHLGAHLRGSGERSLRVPVPYGLVHGLARALYSFPFVRRRRLPGLLVPSRLEARFKPLRYTSRRAREVLGWTPPLTYEVCLERTYGTPTPGSGVAR
jgi:UDP-glucose 4-epimerase